MPMLHDYAGAARRYERLGLHHKAAIAFVNAAGASAGALTKARYYKGASINFRLAGKLDYADVFFDTALEYAQQASKAGDAEGDTEVSNIQRDWAMVSFERGEFESALELLEISRDGHKSRGEWLEMHASISFIGRVYAAQGDLEQARRCFDQAHLGLLDSTQPVWSLNNTIHYMQVMGPTPRLFLGFTALELAVKTHHWRRLLEALVLIAPGPRAYDTLKQRLQRHEPAVATS